MHKTKMKYVLFTAGIIISNTSPADIYLNGTRVIYPAEKKEVTFTVGNNAGVKTLIQTWIDEGKPNETPDNTKAPFILTPPLAAIGAQRAQNIRVSYSGEKVLPTNKESLFWINVLEAPRNTQDPNELRISLRTRIKLFYRPQKLDLKPDNAPEKISWKLEKKESKWFLAAQNNSPYFVTLNKVTVKTEHFTGIAKLTAQNSMIAPQDLYKYELTPDKTVPEDEINFATINDFGGASIYTAKITKTTPIN
jgi:P pilus assembly chaperone PapD